MNLKEMRELVSRELEHISGWPKPQQPELRMYYNIRRLRSLGKKAKEKKTAFQVLRDCIETVKRDYPDFEFLYDKAFFRGKGK